MALEVEMPADRRTATKLVGLGALRALLSATLVIVLYFVAPLDWFESLPPPMTALIAVGILTGVVVVQVRGILRSDLPALRAVEALAISVPLFLVLFAAGYYLMSASDTAAFTEPLDRLAALYYSMTVFSTVGFGDIAPGNQTARASTTIQMALDLVIIGLGARVILGAVRMSRQEHSGTVAPSPGSRTDAG